MNQEIKIKKQKVNHHLKGLSKKGGDLAEWISEDVAYTVDFRNDNPFTGSSVIPVPAAGSGSGVSTPIRADAEEREYHYVLTPVGAQMGSDPDVEILP